MKNITPLTKKAIEAAREQDWNRAIEINEEILKEKPQNVGAMNRLALARMQKGHVRIAEDILNKILKIDRHNKIAKKNLKKAQNKERGRTVAMAQRSSYIEEPGKAKLIELIRVTDDKILDDLAMGQTCCLEAKKAYISVTTEDGQYLGTLPRDISTRLIKLIKSGNKYSCQIHSIKDECCKILAKETHVAKENKGITSFPVTHEAAQNGADELAAEYQVKDDIPMEIVNTDTDEEPSEDDLDDIPRD